VPKSKYSILVTVDVGSPTYGSLTNEVD